MSARISPRLDDDASSASPGHYDVGLLAQSIGYMLRRAQLTVFERVIREFGRLNLRPAQYSVLVLIEHVPGQKQSDVAAALGIQRANFVVLFDELERRGLAERRPSAHDRRSYALHITPAGAEVLNQAHALNAESERHWESVLGPGGREQLLQLLHRLQSATP